jgi:hypothetical protein
MGPNAAMGPNTVPPSMAAMAGRAGSPYQPVIDAPANWMVVPEGPVTQAAGVPPPQVSLPPLSLSPAPPNTPPGLMLDLNPFAAAGGNVQPFPRIDIGAGPRYQPGDVPVRHGRGTGHAYVPTGPMRTTPAGYVPGSPVMETPELGEGLARLQAGETGFDLGGGTFVRFTGIPQGKHNVLRDLQESPLGGRVNQLESMTIELVAMLFDFIFETRDLPDGIKALLARLQIPVLKAAMLDGAFFAKKSHPARVLVNALAQAGLGWSPPMGHDDPLYQKIHDIVHKILDTFIDDLAIFETLRTDLEQFVAAEEKAAEANIHATAEEIHEHDRREVAPVVARLQTERRIETYPVPNFSRRSCGSAGRNCWSRSISMRATKARPGTRRSPPSKISSGACSRRRRAKIASIWSRCCRRC